MTGEQSDRSVRTKWSGASFRNNLLEYLPSVRDRVHGSVNLTRELKAPSLTPHGGEPPGSEGRGPREPGSPGESRCPGGRLTPLPRRAGLGPRSRHEGVALAVFCSAGRGRAGASGRGRCHPGAGGGTAAGAAAVVPDMLFSGRISNPRPQPPPLSQPRRAPATGGGPRIIGRAAQRRVLIGRRASRPRSSAHRRLHFVGRGRRGRSVGALRWSAAVSSVLVGFARSVPRLSLEGEGGFDAEQEPPPP